MKQRAQVTIVSKSDEGWHVSEIARALKDRGITHSVIDFDPSKALSPQMKTLGDITLWRASSLDSRTQRSSVVHHLNKTMMVNEAVFRQPAVAEKYYQQQAIAAMSALSEYAIPTFMVRSKSSLQKIITRGDLKFPVIAKPNNGSRGEGIHLLEKPEDIAKLDRPIEEYVLQGFMENDGDWRVVVMGGRPLGAMKRVAQDGGYLNNVSRGAYSFKETDEATLGELFALAPKVAALFRLRFCGVDLIRDRATGSLKILEVNTAPQWTGEFGFQAVTGVNIGDQFAQYAQHLLALPDMSRPLVDKIDAYYKDTIAPYPADRFHYASRTWLWKRDSWSRTVLDEMRDWHIGDSPESTRRILARIVARIGTPLSVNQAKAHRKPYFDKYRLLPAYNTLLFKVIFCDSLYGYDIRPYVRELVADEDLLELFNSLRADRDAVRVLSTHAINFFYLLKNYFVSQDLGASVLIDPSELLELASDYSDLIERKILTEKNALKLQIYLLTHAIIGESKFYQDPVVDDHFRDMCEAIEKIIRNHYFDISLDNKLEFLVCADICQYATNLRELILAEAKRSVSWAGVFIIDKDFSPMRHVLSTSEHRNVLYVMASHKKYMKAVQ